MPRHSPDAFTGAGRALAAYSRSKFVVIPVGYEKTATYLKGTKAGPAAILDASRNMETFDEVLGRDTTREGIHCLPPIYPRSAPEVVASRLEKTVRKILIDGKVPALLGGEHSLSLGPIRAARGVCPDLGIVHLDAHTDLRDSYEGTRYGHGCVMRRALEICPITQVGIRSLSEEEARLVNAGSVRTFFAHRTRGGSWPPRGLLDRVPKHVYLSIDMDVFDPSLVPGVGTPEPGGLTWDEVTSVVAAVASKREVIAFDVVEIRPLPGSVVSEFTAAKLTYRIMGHIVAASSRRRKRPPARRGKPIARKKPRR